MTEPALPPVAAPATQAEPGEGAEHVQSHAEGRLITAIGIFKAFKGVILLATAAGVFELLGKDLDDLVDHLVAFAHLAPDSRLVTFLYDQADTITSGKLKAIASVGVVYGCLLCTEGYGLLRRRKWAELLVVIATLIPVPFELYELIHEPSFKKVGALILNLAIVAYLIRRRQQFTTRKQRKAARESQKAPAKPELAA
ncbi:MAG: DUF2127 domain-containing protein [Deltaproteobacteria bacterium]|nr:DUF2127 domain-containing protein [Deltaproteobacteria bacterium]